MNPTASRTENRVRPWKDCESRVKAVLPNRLIFAAAIFFVCLPAAAASPPSPITLHDAATMTNAEASKHLPVSFEATVTYFRSYDNELFVQEGGDAIYVGATTTLKLTPGDRIRVTGTMHESFRPYVESKQIWLLGHGELPKPEHPSYEQMIRGETDCKFVTVRAFVRSANFVPNHGNPTPMAFLRLTVDGGKAVREHRQRR